MDKYKAYKATLKHDNGKLRLVVWATSEKEAIKAICEAEKCPERAIIRIKEYKLRR